jgi:alpha-glucosidase
MNLRIQTLLLAATLALAASATAQTPAELHAAAAPTHDPLWYDHAVVYEIYPRSFQDTNHDGIGDLNGIIQRLPYLESLGVDAIWIAPMYPSPQVDFGYDISDYTAVDPQYGTLADFDHLVAAARQHHIRIVLDMVLNHTSDKHPWFLDSASSRTNPHADWYIWNDGIAPTTPGVTDYQRRFLVHSTHGDVVPPTNWPSHIGGSARQWVPARQQFYYHKFYKQQPDLNWSNPAVERAMFDAMRFWLDRGVAGFRLDAINALFEDPQLRNEAPRSDKLNAYGDPELHSNLTSDLPEVFNTLRRLRAMVDSYPPNAYPNQRVLIGEVYLPDSRALDRYYGGPAHDLLQLPMDMALSFANPAGTRLDAASFRKAITDAETQLHGATPLFVFNNHDQPRSFDRYGDGVHNPQIARILAAVLFTTRSSALLYNGEEIGMTTHTPTRVEDVRDPIGITGWPKEKGRDGERTPMQWTPEPPSAGFSTNPHTWLPIGPDYKTVNVATETADPDSLLHWYKTLIALRRSNPALHDGGTLFLDNTNSSVLSYVRTAPAGGKPVLISMNMTAQPQTIHLDLAAAGIASTRVRTILTDAEALNALTTVSTFTVPPFATLITEIQ